MRVFPDAAPDRIRSAFDEPLPETPESLPAVLDEIEEKLLPYCTHVGHPGYMGLITPSPNPVGVIGDFICSALNQNLGVYSIGPSAVAMERRVVRWLTDMVGYGRESRREPDERRDAGELHRAEAGAGLGVEGSGAARGGHASGGLCMCRTRGMCR